MNILGATGFGGLWALRLGVPNFFLDQSIGIDETNTFQFKFFYSKKIVGATGFGGLWDLRFGVPNFLLDQSKGIDETNSS